MIIRIVCFVLGNFQTL